MVQSQGQCPPTICVRGVVWQFDPRDTPGFLLLKSNHKSSLWYRIHDRKYKKMEKKDIEISEKCSQMLLRS